MSVPPVPGVSIIMCTRNGSGTICDALSALAACPSELPRELILVDNGSSDNVREIAEQHWQRIGASYPLRSFREERAGKSFAFALGARAACHAHIVICDDDNILAPDYLERAVALMQDASIGAAGGAGTLKTEGEIPSHFFNFAPWFAVGSQIENPDEAELDLVDLSAAHPGKPLWGAGLVLRLEDLRFLASVKDFPLIPGTHKCEDSELCHAIALMGGRLVYTPRLRFEHMIHPTRMQPSRIRNRLSYDQMAGPAIACYLQLRRLDREGVWRTIARFPWRLVRAAITSGPISPLLFGVLCQLRCPWAMNETQAQAYRIFRQLKTFSGYRRQGCDGSARTAARPLRVAAEQLPT